MAKAAAKAELKTAPTPPQPIAQPPRQGANGMYYDRDGNPISRKGVASGGEGWSPRPPQGYDYQWIRVYVRGNPEYSEYHDMLQAGWRPVPQSQHANLFPNSNDEKLGLTGCILKGGQLLVERPLGMTIEAREEDRRKATGQVMDQLRNHGIQVPDGVRGMDTSRSDVRRNSFAGAGRDKNGSVDPRDTFVVSETPNYELAPLGDE